jgi:hypothetical protein
MLERVNSSMIYLIYYKNYCEWHNVPPPTITIKKEKSFQLLTSHYLEDSVSPFPCGLFPCGPSERIESLSVEKIDTIGFIA